MEILKSNFPKLSKKFFEILKKTNLIAIDLEMAGIRDMYLQSTDLPFEHYFKTHNAANKYQIIQVGICLFSIKDPASNPSNDFLEKLTGSLEAHPFTMYVFPQSLNGKLDRDITLQSSAVEFNVSSGGVNWVKWITDSLNYFDLHDQKRVKEIVQKDRFQLKPNYEYKLFHVEQEEEQDALIENFAEWYKKKESLISNVQDIADDDEQENLKAKGQFFDINAKGYNVIMNTKKKLLAQYKDIYIATRKNLDKDSRFKTVNRAYKIKPEDLGLIKELEEARTEQRFQKKLEFSQIWDELKTQIKNRQIPVIGHNCMMDMEFLISHFERRLTPDFLRFKRLTRNAFSSGVFDTKILADEIKMKRKSLGDLYKYVEKEIKTENTCNLASGFEFSEGVAHNAGYDAYMTGICFWKLLQHLTPDKVRLYQNNFKMFSVFNYNIDLGSDDMDIINSDKVFSILLEPSAVNHVINSQKKENPNQIEEEVSALVGEFAKMHIETQANEKNFHESRGTRNGVLDSRIHKSFVKFCRKRLDEGFSTEKYRVFEHERTHILGNVYFIMIELRKDRKSVV